MYDHDGFQLFVYYIDSFRRLCSKAEENSNVGSGQKIVEKDNFTLLFTHVDATNYGKWFATCQRYYVFTETYLNLSV
jgi:hypothetical protein